MKITPKNIENNYQPLGAEISEEKIGIGETPQENYKPQNVKDLIQEVNIANGAITPIKVSPSLRSSSHNLVFSATDADTVAWAAGTITLADGSSYSITAGNTGNMTARTYIYLDLDVSATVLQTTTTFSSAVGEKRILIATAINGTGEATYFVLGGIGGINIDANSIVVANLAALSADLGTITAGNITLDSSGYIKGGQTAYNTGAGFFLGYATDAYKLSIGNSADVTKLLLWDGTNLIVNGSYLSLSTVYGDGSDGDVTISADTTLTSDMFYNNLTINSTKVLTTGGYRIFVKGILTGAGTIRNNGGNGGNAVPGADPTTYSVPGVAGTAAGSGSTIATLPGEVGEIVSQNGFNGDAAAKSIGVVGVAGGNGGFTNGSAFTGGLAGSQTGTVYNKINNLNSAYYLLDTQPSIVQFTLSSGSGSGAGGKTGGAGGQHLAGAGGGSGAPGGLTWIAAKSITGTLTIEAEGGGGGNGANGAAGDANGGGGGGAGSGGVIMIIYSTKTGLTTSVAGGTGGNPGSGAGTAATAGANGTAGSVVYIQA